MNTPDDLTPNQLFIDYMGIVSDDKKSKWITSYAPSEVGMQILSNGPLIEYKDHEEPILRVWHDEPSLCWKFQLEAGADKQCVAVTQELMTSTYFDNDYLLKLLSYHFHEFFAKYPQAQQHLNQALAYGFADPSNPLIKVQPPESYSPGSLSGTNYSSAAAANSTFSSLAYMLPGTGEYVKHPHPDAAGLEMPLRDIIISLNDSYRWTREEIADWLDTLDVDLRFKTEESENNLGETDEQD